MGKNLKRVLKLNRKTCVMGVCHSMVIMSSLIGIGSFLLLMISIPLMQAYIYTLIANAQETYDERARAANALRLIPKTLIRGETTNAVYFLGDDLRRYVFPNERVFKTWYDDFSGVKVIPDAALASFPLMANITYRPGIKLVKIQSDPKVYAVDNGAHLRWIPSESIAIDIYGNAWNKMIDDIPVVFWSDYTFGEQLLIASEFDPQEVLSRSPDIVIDWKEWKLARLRAIDKEGTSEIKTTDGKNEEETSQAPLDTLVREDTQSDNVPPTTSPPPTDSPSPTPPPPTTPPQKPPSQSPLFEVALEKPQRLHDTTVKLSWPNKYNANWTYFVERKRKSEPTGAFVLVSGSLPAESTYIDDTPSDNGEYSYRLTACASPCTADGIAAINRVLAPVNILLKKNYFKERYIKVKVGAIHGFSDAQASATVNELIALMERGHELGYNGFLISTTLRPPMNAKAKDRAKPLVDRARALGWELLPWGTQMSTPQGTKYSDGTDPRDGIPVIRAPFQRAVGSSIAEILVEPTSVILDAGFELSPACYTKSGSSAAQCVWGVKDKVSADTGVYRSGAQSIKNEDATNGNARVYQEFNVNPFRMYELSAYFKTQGWQPSPVGFKVQGVNALAGGVPQRLVPSLGCTVNSTQSWTQCSIEFNSLANSRISIDLYAGGPSSTGKLWVDDVSIKEVGFPSDGDVMVKKNLMPFLVTNESGSITYQEGSDYTINYGQRALNIPSGSAIQEDNILKVSYYTEPLNPSLQDRHAAACYQQFYNEFVEHEAAAFHDIFGTDRHGIIYDEISSAGWDAKCADDAQFQSGGTFSLGKYIAYIFRESINAVKRGNPGAKIYVFPSLLYGWGETLASQHGWNGGSDNNSEGFNSIPAGTTMMISTVPENSEQAAKAKQRIREMTSRGYNVALHGYYIDLSSVADWVPVLNDLDTEGVNSVHGFQYGAYAAAGVDQYRDLEATRDIWEEAGRWAYNE